MERIYQRYQEVISSPTLKALTNVRNVIAEARLMNQEREVFATDRLSRIEKYSKRRKIGNRVRPRGDFITSVRFPNIQAQHKATLATEEVKQQRTQLRSTRSIIIQEIKALKALWKEEIESRVSQGQPRLTWNQWLSETDTRPRYDNLEAQRKEHNEVLSQPPKKVLYEAQEQARRAPRPIIAMDQTAWPDSDDKGEFRGIGLFQDDDDDIDLIGLDDSSGDDLPGAETPLGITSSPPLDPLDPADYLDDDNVTLPHLPVTTPRIPGYQRVKNLLRQFREEQINRAARAISS